MICASSEIGLFDLFPFTEEATILGLCPDFDAPAGTPLADALDLHDIILEIDNKSMTNRPDLWGLLRHRPGNCGPVRSAHESPAPL